VQIIDKLFNNRSDTIKIRYEYFNIKWKIYK